MGHDSVGMLAFLGVAADRRLLDDDLVSLPNAEQHREPAISTRKHAGLVATGSLMTGLTLVGGAAMTLYCGWLVLFHGGGVIAGALAAIGTLLVATHWGWVHVAEYLGLSIDAHEQRATDERNRDWLARIEPYPRFSVATDVLDDASTRIVRVLHQPVMTPRHTFTFVRRTDAEETFDSNASAEVIASAVETMRRRARTDTDRIRGLWETASAAYAAALSSANDDRQKLAAERAAATALSEHINASLLEPPLVE